MIFCMENIALSEVPSSDIHRQHHYSILHKPGQGAASQRSSISSQTRNTLETPSYERT